MQFLAVGAWILIRPSGRTAVSFHSRGCAYNITLLYSPLLTLHPMSPSTPEGDSPIWSLFQTVLGVSAPPLVLRSLSHRVHLLSPLSKSPLSAFLATSSRDEASLIRQHRRSSHFSLIIPPHRLICSFTAIKHHKRQLLHSLSTLLQSRLLPFPRSATILIDLANCSLFSPEKLRELWIIPIFFLLVTGVSLGVAWLLGNLFRLKPSQRYLLVLISQAAFSPFSQKLCNGCCHIHELKFPSGRPFAIARRYRPRTQMGRRRHKGRYDRTCSHLLAPM
jgi:hypothetical protein